MHNFLRCSTAVCWIVCAARAEALDASKGIAGANHARAQRYASGAGVSVGVFDTVFFGVAEPHHFGTRLLAQYDFYNKLPSQDPEPLASPVDDHERLVAHVIASDDALNTGVAPAAQIYVAAISDVNLQSRRAASAWLHAHHGISIFNLSAQFGPNTNGTSNESLYWDWFMRERDTLLVVAAGNTGFQSVIPADAFNGISVGAYDQATGARWSSSAYALDGGAAGTEVRGKPDILAPGVGIGDGISYGGFFSSGTSFAAPHVAGAAALLKEYTASHGAGDTLDHRGIKALLLNSARKRNIVAPEILSPASSDSAIASAAFDKDYLHCSLSECTVANPATAGLTTAWTPSAWTYDGNMLSVTKPLDDEQGVGFLDATRAVINLAGGRNLTTGPVAGIGWDQSIIQPADSPAAHVYALNQTLAAGSFLTATLAWDRVALESDGDGIVDDDDTYAFGELANLDLCLLGAGDQVVAESISLTDNVEHLHVPLPVDALPGDYKLQVLYNGGGTLTTNFALAWWTDPTPLVPGDYNLDGTVDALDYEVWRTNFATTSDTVPLIYADGNLDGIVDSADYAIWRHHVGDSWLPGATGFANSLGATGSAKPLGATGFASARAAVPECPTLLLTCLISMSLVFIRCR